MYVFVYVTLYLSSSCTGQKVRGDQRLEKAKVRTEGWTNRTWGVGKDSGQV